MTISRPLTALALCLAIGCVHVVSEPASTTPAPASNDAPPPPPPVGYSLHEWGLFAVDVDANGTAHVATGVAHSAPQPTVGTGAGRGYAYKPVIYAHLDDGVSEARFDVRIGIPPDHFLERWPGGTDVPNDGIPMDGGWRGVVATRGACANPTPAPTECAATFDGFCESTEIPRYYGDRDTCLRADGAETDLLFYRTAAVPSDPLPLRVGREGAGFTVARTSSGPLEGPALYIVSDGSTTHLYSLAASALDGTVSSEGLAEITPDAARTLLSDEAQRRGLTAMEAEAFVDAWSPAYFAHCTRTGPEASGTIPPSLHQARASLLYFAPNASVDAMLPLITDPPAREVRRVFLVRAVDAAHPLDQPSETAVTRGDHGTVIRLAGPPTVTGDGINRDQVRRVVQRHIAELRHCYEQAIRVDPTLQGRITLTSTLAADGSVSSVAVNGAHPGPESLATCFTTAMRRWSYPAPTSGTPSFETSFTLAVAPDDEGQRGRGH